jgi:hypothetical protein
VFGFADWLVDRQQRHVRTRLGPVWADDRRSGQGQLLPVVLMLVPPAAVYVIVARAVVHRHATVATEVAILTAAWRVYATLTSLDDVVNVAGAAPAVEANEELATGSSARGWHMPCRTHRSPRVPAPPPHRCSASKRCSSGTPAPAGRCSTASTLRSGTASGLPWSVATAPASRRWPNCSLTCTGRAPAAQRSTASNCPRGSGRRWRWPGRACAQVPRLGGATRRPDRRRRPRPAATALRRRLPGHPRWPDIAAGAAGRQWAIRH